MKSNPVVHSNLIIRSQAEYSPATQTVIMRCVLETPTTGQRRGFTNIDALLAVLRAELLEIQTNIVPKELEGGESVASKQSKNG